ncbi:hypothetical protein [Phenylobacterium sp.]|uniref:hypothetical protein n=1 Tax=Phenylobacterium sp. TaxID=1871053 RepID=UPI002719F2A6|nr:hypothetical protein [Phenylobacterium sp.]MDO8378816.1 hypothetical protein [Phenylobacterium sp.]
MRRVLIASALALVAACSPKAKSAADDQYAGLGDEILAWHKQIQASDKACLSKSDGKGCQGFEVGCKGARELTAIDKAKGVTAKLVVAMSWEGWDPVRSEYRTQSGFSEFTKVDGGWMRNPTGPVNLSTCASA